MRIKNFSKEERIDAFAHNVALSLRRSNKNQTEPQKQIQPEDTTHESRK